jgi:hypothetical protein
MFSFKKAQNHSSLSRGGRVRMVGVVREENAYMENGIILSCLQENQKNSVVRGAGG